MQMIRSQLSGLVRKENHQIIFNYFATEAAPKMELTRFIQVLILTLGLQVSTIFGYKSGPPTFICDSMTPPVWAHGASPQTSAAPYTIAVTRIFNSENKFRVNITGNSNRNKIDGFMMHAEDTNKRQLGTFETIFKTKLMCPGSTTIAQSDELGVRQLSLVWIAPNDVALTTGPVKFKATILQGKRTFWVAVYSASFQLIDRVSTTGTTMVETRTTANSNPGEWTPRRTTINFYPWRRTTRRSTVNLYPWRRTTSNLYPVEWTTRRPTVDTNDIFNSLNLNANKTKVAQKLMKMSLGSLKKISLIMDIVSRRNPEYDNVNSGDYDNHSYD